MRHAKIEPVAWMSEAKSGVQHSDFAFPYAHAGYLLRCKNDHGEFADASAAMVTR